MIKHNTEHIISARLGYFLTVTAKVIREPEQDSLESCAVKFLLDSGSDVVTLRHEIIEKLQLKAVGTVLQKGPIGERQQKLYKGFISIGHRQIQCEVRRASIVLFFI